MQAVRFRITPTKDGELHIEHLPIRRGQPVEVIVLSEESSEESAFTLAVMQNDPAWDFLKNPAEDIYSDDDLLERY